MGFKLVEGEGLREGWDSKELWKSVESQKKPWAEPAAFTRLGRGYFDCLRDSLISFPKTGDDPSDNPNYGKRDK